ncbi:hypothetical protein HDE_06311 [Halotydeus destructor]|nr:hypothetical protein HDE_06311 [Halotydeus destructor]
MDVDETGSRPSSRSSTRRSPMPPPSSTGIILNRPLGHSAASASGANNAFATLPRSGSSSYQQRDYSCPPPMSKNFASRRSSSGIFFTSMFSSRFRHLQKLHSDAFSMGLNAVCMPGLPMGTMFRSSLPATPMCTPIHREPFQQFTEEAIRERLCKTPSPRKNRIFSPLDLDMPIADSRSASRVSQGSEQPMDITCPSTPITESLYEGNANEEESTATGSSSGSSFSAGDSSQTFARPPRYPQDPHR